MTQSINLLLWIALRRHWFLSISYCRSQQRLALLGWSWLSEIPFHEWVQQKFNVLLQYRPQRYRHNLHLSSKNAELAPEQHESLANSCKCLEFRVWRDPKGRKNTAACWPCRARSAEDIVSNLQKKIGVRTGWEPAIWAAWAAQRECVPWCLQLLFWEHHCGAAPLCPQCYEAPALSSTSPIKQHWGLVSLSFCFCSRCVGAASVRGYQGMRRVDEEKDITKGFSLGPFPHTDHSQAPAGRARSSASNLGSL